MRSKNPSFLPSVGSLTPESSNLDNKLLYLKSEEPKIVKNEKPFHCEVKTVLITPNEQTVVVGLEDGEIQLISIIVNDEEFESSVILKGHKAEVKCLCITSDNEKLISGSYDRTIIIWGISSHEQKAVLRDNEDKVLSLAISKDDSWLVSGSIGNTIRIWDLATYTQTSVIRNIQANSFAICMTSDNKFLILGCNDNDIRFWNIAEHREEVKLVGHGQPVYSLGITNDGLYLISTGMDHTIRKWDLSTYKEVALLVECTESIYSLAITTDNLFVVYGKYNGDIGIVSVDGKMKEISIPSHNNCINSICISLTNKYIISGSKDGFVHISNLSEFPEVKTLEGHSRRVYCISFSADSSMMASASDDNTIIIWRLGVEDCEGILNGHKGPVYHVLFTSDTKKCISGSQDSTIVVWELSNEIPLFSLIGHEEAVTCLALDSSDKTLVSGSVDKTVKVWNIESQALEFSFSGHLDKVTCITMSFDNNYAISGSKDKTIKVWDLLEYNVCESFGLHEDEVTSLSFKTSKLDYLTSRSNLATFRSNYIVDYKNLELLADDENFSDRVISASLDKTVKIWKFPDLEIEYILPCKTEVFKLSVTNDFSYMFIQTEKKYIKMWSIPDKQELLTLYEYPEINVLALSPNKQWLVFSSKNKVLSVKSPLSKDSDNTVLPYSYSYLFKVLVHRILNNDKSEKKTIFSKHFFCPSNISLLHVLTYASHNKLLSNSIINGANFFRTKWGETPLSIALARKSKICAEVLIKVFSNSKFSEYPYIFEYLEGLLPILNNSSLPSLHILYKAAFPKIESQDLPTFGTFRGNPPVLRLKKTKNIDPKLFLQNRPNDIENLTDRELEFRRSQITLDLTPGSSQCIKFIQSLLKCKNYEIFKTDFVKSVLKYKWRQIKWVLFIQASLYLILLLTIILNTIVSRHNRTLLVIEIIINTIFLVYELSQAYSGIWDYFKDIWNLCDASRIVLLYFYVFYTVGKADQKAQDVFLVLIQIIMWTRLVGYFRIFDRTRYLIHLLLKVMKDLGPFLVIFFLSNFAASLAFYSDYIETDFGSVLLDTYLISYGVWDFTWPSTLQYFIFILCSLTNTLVLLNLLIAIISDTYSRVSDNLETVDMQELADIILEVDTIIFWNRNKGKRQYLMSCNVAGSNKNSKNDNVQRIVSTKISEIDQKFKQNEKTLDKIKNNLTNIVSKDFTDKNKNIMELILGIKNEFSTFKNEMQAEIRQVNHDISSVKSLLKD